jgi:uncharacterized protein (DUF2141 family)
MFHGFQSLEPRRLMSIDLWCGMAPDVGGETMAVTSAAAAATPDLAPTSLAGRTFTLKVLQSNGPYKNGGTYTIKFTSDSTWTATGGPGGSDTTVSGTYVWLKVNPAGGGLSFMSGSALGPFGGGFTFTSTSAGTFAFSGGNSVGLQSGTFTTGNAPTSTKGSIAGNVFNDLNGNYAKGAGENGLAGRTVWLDTDNDGVKDAAEVATTTDAQGNYKFENLNAGTYNVRVLAPAGQRITAPGSVGKHVVTLLNGQAAAARNFGLTARTQISGVVFKDTDGDGKRDAGEAGMANVRVYIDADNDGQYDVGEIFSFTNSAGNYFLSGPSTGSFKVRQVVPAGHTQSQPAASHTVNATAAERFFGRNFGNDPV